MPILLPPKVPKLVWKNTDENALTDTNRTVTLTWTDLDLTAYTSSTAVAAILILRLTALVVGSGTCSFLRVRKNGTTPTIVPQNVVSSGMATVPVTHMELVIVGLDAGQVIEYAIDVGTGWTISCYIDVVSYFEE